MAAILLRCLKASVNCHHVARRSQMFKKEYKNRERRCVRGLDFEGSLRDTGLAWLPHDLFNWADMCLHDELVASTTFTFNGLQSIFRNWKGVNLVHQDFAKARELENCLRDSQPEEHHDIINAMRKLVYQQFTLHVIRQLPMGSHIGDVPEDLRQGFHGLSVYSVYVITGQAPYLARTRNGNHGLGNTYPERLQTLFDWDDGIARTFWDHCFYRQLARRFHKSISESVSDTEADDWKSSLGRWALPYFWVIPHYDKNRLFCWHGKTDEPGAGRAFISGVHHWSFAETDGDPYNEERWSFGGDTYLPGLPQCFTEKDRRRPEYIEAKNEQQYVIDFGSAIPFSEIPQIIEDGFQVFRQTFAGGDQRVLAHYERARECLAQALGDPQCDLMLMLVLTLCASSETVGVTVGERIFSLAGRKIPPATYAATLVTRMLWFWRREAFPWDEDEGLVLRVPEMVKKIGKLSSGSTYLDV